MRKEREKKHNKKERNLPCVIWLILGIVCLLYFTLLMSYVGLTNVFYLIWLFGGLLCLLFSFLARIHLVKRCIPKPVRVLLYSFIGICFAFFCFIEGLILSGFYREPAGEVDYLIVLGAHVKYGKPSNTLAKRLDAAYDYAIEHEGVKVIVSGGQGSNETTTEAYAMARYLEEKGLDGDRILLEEASRNTDENLTFSYEIAGADAKIAVVSNDFHIFRAVHLARGAGFRDPQGLAARDDVRTMASDLVREFFGVCKDWIYGNIKLFPVR
ncbi:MAG: YdcF family protein [Lachnospiraceae bacterium]|nr:YdcF family protein [Lachnospiraceae bacterium]